MLEVRGEIIGRAANRVDRFPNLIQLLVWHVISLGKMGYMVIYVVIMRYHFSSEWDMDGWLTVITRLFNCLRGNFPAIYHGAYIWGTKNMHHLYWPITFHILLLTSRGRPLTTSLHPPAFASTPASYYAGWALLSKQRLSCWAPKVCMQYHITSTLSE